MEKKDDINICEESYLLGLASSSTLISDEDDHKKLERKCSECKEQAQSLKEDDKKIKSQKLREKIEKLMNKFQSSKLMRGFDKVIFVFGVTRLIIEAFILGRFPCWYPVYYSISTIILVFLRFIYYRWMNWHYFP